MFEKNTFVKNIRFMKQRLLLLLQGLLAGLFASELKAEEPRDTVKVGLYVTSLHDIDFRQKEYTINFWLWFTYRNPLLDFYKNVEIPQAKTFEKTYCTSDTLDDGRIYTLMKVQCVMKDSWKIHNFPFDRQVLRLSIENAEFDSSAFVFDPDTSGKNYGRFALSGWKIDSFSLNSGYKEYETAFGDVESDEPRSTYSSLRLKVEISRDAWGLFWKIFLGMYVSFLIAYVCFYIHADNIDSRFGLSVGSLFAAIGNKYVIDSSLPESSSFTLVDSLHGLTLFFILCGISFSVYALRLTKQGLSERANRVDRRWGNLLLTGYILLNVILILNAMQH